MLEGPFEITLLIPHFNHLADLERSLETVKFSGKMAIVVVDDGSPVNQRPDKKWSANMEKKIGLPIYLILLKENQGIEKALNSGIDFIISTIDTKYIARLDCRDINTADRFDLQYTFLENNPDIWLVGSWAEVVENGRSVYTIKMPSTHEEIKRKMLSNNCFVHPTVMFKKEAIDEVGKYPLGYPAAEDYAYFFLFVHKFQTANIPKVLMQLPASTEGISYRLRKDQLLSRMKVIIHNFRFTRYSLWGLVRTSFLLMLPVTIVEYLKEIYDRTSHH